MIAGGGRALPARCHPNCSFGKTETWDISNRNPKFQRLPQFAEVRPTSNFEIWV
jgi:hypothetical protein